MKNLLAILTIGLLLALTSAVQAAPTHFLVPMSGLQEVPPGDPDGTGTATLLIDPSAKTVKWNIAVQNIDLSTISAQIHEGAIGVEGPVVVDLGDQLSGVSLMDADLPAIVADPTNYYIDVRNATYPSGAIRGQLTCPTTPEVPVPSAFFLAAFGLAGLKLRRRTPA
ncbi:MAG: CHRD domain-containing protein [Solirubrobacterales bacterium]